MADAEQKKEELSSKLEDIDSMYDDVRDELSAYKVEQEGYSGEYQFCSA